MKFPRLTFDYRTHPQLADNIWQAQMAGHPKVLTYAGPDLVLRKVTRKDAMHFEDNGQRYEIPHILSRDEYPFACSLEGGGSSWVGHIPARENSSQGGLIASFIRRHGLAAGNNLKSCFVVRVINHPEGIVTNPCKHSVTASGPGSCPGCERGCRFTQDGDANSID